MNAIKFTSINNTNKQILGQMIKLERERLGLTQKKLIMNKAKAQICSTATLHRLESGQIIKDDTIYHELIHQLGYSFEENPGIDQALPALNEQCMHYFETLNLIEAERILAYINDLFQTSSFYYRQLKQCYIDIINASLFNKRLTEEEYKFYKNLLNIMHESLRILLIHLCFSYANNFLQNLDEMNYYEKLLIQHSDYLLMRIDFQFILKYNYKLEEFLKLNSSIINECKDKLLLNQWCKALSSRCSFLSFFQQPQLNDKVKEVETFIEQNYKQLSPNIISNVKYAIAMIYYADINDFSNAKRILEEIFLENPHRLEASGIYYFSACEMINENPKEVIINRISVNDSNVFLRYFLFKYQQNWNTAELIQYLNSEILENLKREKNQTKIKVFKLQWNKILKESPNNYYSAYYYFMHNFE
ncbi:helix-turn-helix domain-containing protein [Holdemania massiliensis]|uniref:helix-turn-helix domain-containing protein n=1 Tax=Holdemania massiliensis TaxID=1468449 RepID=UPI001F05BCA1|nr:helix-turn-helix transcriptional regulator [Holdemania massiliensis]MCH1941820.1 helix-turn-helix domain-containing protein [Holdemania massiliensis]